MTDRSQAARAFLDQFFPVHYLIGMQVEDALRCGELTRQQACILWTIRMRGENGVTMRRKDIEAELSSWYEVTSSAISKSLRAMTKPPIDLLYMTEDPASGREKLVSLTPKGQKYVERMIASACGYIDEIVEHLTDRDIESGLAFFRRLSEIHEILQEDAPPKKSKA